MKFVCYSNATNGEAPAFAIYTYRGQTARIDAAIPNPADPTLITPAVGRAVFEALGMAAAQYDILAAVEAEAQALNGQAIDSLNPPELNKLVKYMLAEQGYVDADGNVSIL